MPESNLPIFAEAAGSAGFYNVTSDRDGIVRWMPFIIQCGDHLFPAARAGLRLALSRQSPMLVVEADRYGIRGIRMGDRPSPPTKPVRC